jgi:predicted O-methyltransferase YrrM
VNVHSVLEFASTGNRQQPDRLTRLADSAVVRFRALKETLRLSCSRGAGDTLLLISHLTSVHDARLPRVTVADFQKRLVTGPLAERVLLHPRVTGTGSGSIADMVTLATLVAVCRPRQVLEFGTCEGASTWHLWANSPAEASITTLDLPPYTSVAGSTDPDLQGVALRPMLPHDPRVRLIEQDSRTWIPDLRDVEFCFIDAGHSYECVKNDTEKAFSVMRPGGLVVWHDATWRRDGYVVNDYLRELRSAGRDVVLLVAGPLDLCLLAALMV